MASCNNVIHPAPIEVLIFRPDREAEQKFVVTRLRKDQLGGSVGLRKVIAVLEMGGGSPAPGGGKRNPLHGGENAGRDDGNDGILRSGLEGNLQQLEVFAPNFEFVVRVRIGKINRQSFPAM